MANDAKQDRLLSSVQHKRFATLDERPNQAVQKCDCVSMPSQSMILYATKFTRQADTFGKAINRRMTPGTINYLTKSNKSVLGLRTSKSRFVFADLACVKQFDGFNDLGVHADCEKKHYKSQSHGQNECQSRLESSIS